MHVITPFAGLPSFMTSVTVTYTEANRKHKEKHEYQNPPEMSMVDVNNDLSVFNFNQCEARLRFFCKPSTYRLPDIVLLKVPLYINKKHFHLRKILYKFAR